MKREYRFVVEEGTDGKGKEYTRLGALPILVDDVEGEVEVGTAIVDLFHLFAATLDRQEYPETAAHVLQLLSFAAAERQKNIIQSN